MTMLKVAAGLHYRLENKGFECQQDQEIFPSPKCPDWLWPPNLLVNEYWGSFACSKMAGALSKSLVST